MSHLGKFVSQRTDCYMGSIKQDYRCFKMSLYTSSLAFLPQHAVE